MREYSEKNIKDFLSRIAVSNEKEKIVSFATNETNSYSFDKKSIVRKYEKTYVPKNLIDNLEYYLKHFGVTKFKHDHFDNHPNLYYKIIETRTYRDSNRTIVTTDYPFYEIYDLFMNLDSWLKRKELLKSGKFQTNVCIREPYSSWEDVTHCAGNIVYTKFYPWSDQERFEEKTWMNYGGINPIYSKSYYFDFAILECDSYIKGLFHGLDLLFEFSDEDSIVSKKPIKDNNFFDEIAMSGKLALGLIQCSRIGHNLKCKIEDDPYNIFDHKLTNVLCGEYSNYLQTREANLFNDIDKIESLKKEYKILEEEFRKVKTELFNKVDQLKANSSRF